MTRAVGNAPITTYLWAQGTAVPEACTPLRGGTAWSEKSF
jgi:hypothetical protein